MTDFSQTIAVAVNCFGGSPASRWGTNSNITMVWGSTKWGEGSVDLETRTVKLISESIAGSETITKSPRHLISEAMTLVGDMGTETLQDQAGYYRVFPDRVTDAEDRSFTTWTSAAAAGGSWSTAAATTTTWSEA